MYSKHNQDSYSTLSSWLLAVHEIYNGHCYVRNAVKDISWVQTCKYNYTIVILASWPTTHLNEPKKLIAIKTNTEKDQIPLKKKFNVKCKSKIIQYVYNTKMIKDY